MTGKAGRDPPTQRERGFCSVLGEVLTLKTPPPTAAPPGHGARSLVHEKESGAGETGAASFGSSESGGRNDKNDKNIDTNLYKNNKNNSNHKRKTKSPRAEKRFPLIKIVRYSLSSKQQRNSRSFPEPQHSFKVIHSGELDAHAEQRPPTGVEVVV